MSKSHAGFWSIVVWFICAGSLAGCGGAESEPITENETTTGDEAPPPPPPPPPPPAHVRVIHAAFDPLAAAVGVSFDGADPVVRELAYQQASAYFELAPGEHSVSLLGSDGSEILAWSPPTLGEDRWATLVLSSSAAMPVSFAMADDLRSTPSMETMTALRFFHAIDGMDEVDVCIAGESPRSDGILIFSAMAPGTFAGSDEGRYAEMAPGEELTIQFRASNARPCHGRIQGVARVSPAPNARYTLVAVGRVERPRVDRELLVCADPPAETSCEAVQISAR